MMAKLVIIMHAYNLLFILLFVLQNDEPDLSNKFNTPQHTKVNNLI